MFILLPPSETKRVSIQGPAFIAPGPELFLSERELVSEARVRVWDAYKQVLSDFDLASRMLKLGRYPAVEHGRLTGQDGAVGLPAYSRYDGTLYKALGMHFAETYLAARSQPHPLGILVQSALFGLIDLLDFIPYYRLSYNTPLPTLSLRETWATAYGAQFSLDPSAPILDLRSGGYRDLLPIQSGQEVFRVHVVDKSGERSLNHFNKKFKGEFVSAVCRLWLQQSAELNLVSIVQEAAEKAKLGVEFKEKDIRLRVFN